VDPIDVGPVDPKEIDEFIDKLAKEIVKRHLAAPAIVMLESMKPLSFVGSQAMVFFNPLISIIGNMKSYALFQKILEDRELLDKLISAIESEEEK
jgi:hypothetical protein